MGRDHVVAVKPADGKRYRLYVLSTRTAPRGSTTPRIGQAQRFTEGEAHAASMWFVERNPGWMAQPRKEARRG